MKDHGLLFKSEMVCAFLREHDPKSMTRRICKNLEWVETHGAVYIGKPVPDYWRYYDKTGSMAFDPERDMELLLRQCPWSVGDRVYCKETWDWQSLENARWTIQDYILHGGRVRYRADGCEPYDKWIPSIFMPKRASRLWFEITDIKAERVKDISEEDAKAEGVGSHNMGTYSNASLLPMPKEWYEAPEDERWTQKWHPEGCPLMVAHSIMRNFINTWERIHGPGSWEANPWVFALTLKRIEKPSL